MVTPDELHRALLTLAADADPTHPRHDASWRVVERAIRRVSPGRGADEEDRRQETLIRVLRSLSTFEPMTPVQSFAWLRTIARNARIDEWRRSARQPATLGLAKLPADEDREAPVERLAAPEPNIRDPERLDAVLALVELEVARDLEAHEAREDRRAMAKVQARAALQRLVLGQDLDGLVAALGYEEPLSRDRVYKWVERGRAVVLRALDHWEREQGMIEGVSEACEVLRSRMSDRRADAGQPRPERRKR